jgi:hypothetical protein
MRLDGEAAILVLHCLPDIAGMANNLGRSLRSMRYTVITCVVVLRCKALDPQETFYKWNK